MHWRRRHGRGINVELLAFYPEIFAYACGFNEAEELEVGQG
jgi:hypothetical protein